MNWRKKDMFNVCLGITNKVPDGFQIPFFDYDCKFIGNCRGELERIQNDYGLSDIFLIKSTNGFNAFSLDKLPVNILRELMKISSKMDERYIEGCFRRGYSTLRLGEDKIFFLVIKQLEFTRYELSYAHALFFSKYFNKELIDLSSKRLDKNTFLQLETFESSKHNVFDRMISNRQTDLDTNTRDY